MAVNIEYKLEDIQMGNDSITFGHSIEKLRYLEDGRLDLGSFFTVVTIYENLNKNKIANQTGINGASIWRTFHGQTMPKFEYLARICGALSLDYYQVIATYYDSGSAEAIMGRVWGQIPPRLHRIFYDLGKTIKSLPELADLPTEEVASLSEKIKHLVSTTGKSGKTN